jgi:hypothetical protein
VGEVRSVYGKDKTQEEIAGVVYSFLKDIERQRGEQLDIEDRKRKHFLDVRIEGKEENTPREYCQRHG